MAYQVDVEAPVEHVWSFLNEPDKLSLWMPEIIDTVPLADGRYVDEADDDEDLMGARFRQSVRIGRQIRQLDGDVTLYHPPWLLGLRLTCDSFKLMLTFDVYPIGNGTRLDYRADVILAGWAAPLLELVNRRRCACMMTGHLANLKALAEASLVPVDLSGEPVRPPIAAE